MATKRATQLLRVASNPVISSRVLCNCSKFQLRSYNITPLVARRGNLRVTPPSSYLQATRRASSASSSNEPLAKTPLYDLHASNGAKFVPFGGYEMPVQYNDLSVGESHRWTREKASIFDVSHMVQQTFSGSGAADFLARITPTATHGLKPHQSTLSALLLETGGIVDDTMIMRLSESSFYVVTNAGRREADKQYFTQQLQKWNEENKPNCNWEILSSHGLIALQGPLSQSILSTVLYDSSKTDLSTLYFGSSAYITIRLPDGSESSPLLASRGGYTGEDGFEISIPGPETTAVTSVLLSSAGSEKLRLAGLGARDSLRLEAGMCLYGHDLNESTTPPEAGLAWIVGKDRRDPSSANPFYGSSVILEQLKLKKDGGKGVSRKRIGLIVEGAPAREGAIITSPDGSEIGTITSGCPSPTLGKNIAMGYVKSSFSKSGTELSVLVRNKSRKAVVTKMPFVETKYFRG